MKKIISLLLVFVSVLGIFAQAGVNPAQAAEATQFTPNATVDPRNKPGKYFILNQDGSYGGSYDELAYGKGAPLNGEYDVENSQYFITDDYFNLPSTEERTLFPNFSPYQQTMQDTSGIACVLMVLNYLGYDVKNQYSEIELLKKYEQVNGKTVYGKGTTPTGLKKLVESLGLGFEVQTSITGELDFSAKEYAREMIEQILADGKFLLVRWQSPTDFGWKVVIGYDDMGPVLNCMTNEMRDFVNDDMLIFAEPNDCYDHFQDGYTVTKMKEFHMWWLNMNAAGTISDKYSFVVIDPKIDIDFNRQAKDLTEKQTYYDVNIPRNPNGDYGGTRDKTLYGPVRVSNGGNNHKEANYVKHTDYYNMKSEGSRLLLENYQILQQTMYASCGICSTSSIIKHYGFEPDTSYYDLEEKLALSFNTMHNVNINQYGIPSMRHLMEALRSWGYSAYVNATAAGNLPRFTTYEQWAAFLQYHLANDRPISFGANAGSAHFITVIGFDDMGTDYIYDDVIITSDSADFNDHYQDSYVVYPATAFYRHDTSGNHKYLQQYAVVYGAAS